MEETKTPEEATDKIEEMKALAAAGARVKSRNARWDLNCAIFLFAILILVIILLFQGFGIEWVGPIAIFGLAMVWLVGWRRGRQLYSFFYDEELSRLERESQKPIEQTLEETVEERVQKALRDRWK
ncbi:MAG: hypothetical protein JSW30_02485 [Dehalococcoidia bacterium]|nr:MAG: hypothetical protein JSW30_02485 [Dehalococcoidia bacterium]